MKWHTMIAIVGRGQADKVMAAAREAGAPGGTICNARGTASSSILAALGLGDTRKEVLFSVISRGNPDAILSAVHNVKAKGVVMMTDAVVDEDYEEGKMDYKWVLIEVICEEGYSEDIMVTARKAGASGGTVINAHGTSTHHNDLFETRAIKKLFGDHAHKLKVNSTKSMIGHLLGAAGAVEFIACVKEIENSYIHKTVGYQVPDEECDLDYVTGQGQEMEIEYALSNSLGFGGHNASLLIKKYHD